VWSYGGSAPKRRRVACRRGVGIDEEGGASIFIYSMVSLVYNLRFTYCFLYLDSINAL
jgi:hypothetical protein